jgi:hypothetical protein
LSKKQPWRTEFRLVRDWGTVRRREMRFISFHAQHMGETYWRLVKIPCQKSAIIGTKDFGSQRKETLFLRFCHRSPEG